MAAREGYVDSNQRVVHSLNSYRATDPATSVHSGPAGNYRHHDEFSVEIEKTWSLQGTVVANPTLTVTRHCMKGDGGPSGETRVREPLVKVYHEM